MHLSNIYYLHEIGSKKNQEDYIWPVPGNAGMNDKYFIVCDGVGGSENGEVASKIVAEYTGNTLLKGGGKNLTVQYINEILNDAKEELIRYAKKNGLVMDMATTFSLLALSGETAFVAWCGDSRVFHIRDGLVIYKTSDHSLVNSLVKSGEITEEEALTHPRKNVILKAVTADESPADADGVQINDIKTGDYFLLCSDGLLENISEKNLSFLLKQNDEGTIDLVKSFQHFCFEKTRDNYSMYLVKIQKDEIKPVSQKKKSTKWPAVIIVLAIITLGGGFYFNTPSKKETGAPFAVTDSVSGSTTPAINTDSISIPNKDSLNNPTTMAAPLAPDSSKLVKDSVKKKIKIPVKIKDSTNKHLPLPVASPSQPVQKADSTVSKDH